MLLVSFGVKSTGNQTVGYIKRIITGQSNTNPNRNPNPEDVL